MIKLGNSSSFQEAAVMTEINDDLITEGNDDSVAASWI